MMSDDERERIYQCAVKQMLLDMRPSAVSNSPGVVLICSGGRGAYFA